MSSSIKRRSGTAVVEFCKLMEWAPDMVFQVGIGQIYEEVDAFQKQWPDMKFVGCEPYLQLVKSIKRKYPGLVMPIAVSKEWASEVLLYIKSKHKNGSSLFDHNARNPRNVYDTILVQSHSLNWIKKNCPEPLGKNMLLWLDCEGSELDVLLQCNDFMPDVNMINVEMTCIPLGAGWCRAIDVHRKLHELGFAQAWCHTNRIHAAQFDAIYVRREMLKPELCMCLSELGNVPDDEQWRYNMPGA